MNTEKNGFVFVSVLMIIVALMLVLGAASRSAFYNAQLVRAYVDDVKSYYMAVTGVHFIRQYVYNDANYVIYPKVKTDSARLTIGGYEGLIKVTKLPNAMNADITSTGTYNARSTTILCSSGDGEMDLSIEQCMLGAVSPQTTDWSVTRQHNFAEAELPVVKWKIEKEVKS